MAVMRYPPVAQTTVVYYGPFQHYLAADLVRVFTLAAALTVTACVSVVAVRRWQEERRSSAVFLIALSASMFVQAVAGLAGLGHPPVWWLLILRFVPIVLTFAACGLVIREARRGVWARRH